jgi:hypothetical protein
MAHEQNNEALAKELLRVVMPNAPWDHNTAILQDIYRELAQYVSENFVRKSAHHIPLELPSKTNI